MQVRETHPDLTIILYISGSGGLLERMAAAQPDVISIDQRVDMRDAIQRIGPQFAVQVSPAGTCWCKVSAAAQRSVHAHDPLEGVMLQWGD